MDKWQEEEMELLVLEAVRCTMRYNVEVNIAMEEFLQKIYGQQNPIMQNKASDEMIRSCEEARERLHQTLDELKNS